MVIMSVKITTIRLCVMKNQRILTFKLIFPKGTPFDLSLSNK